MPPLAGDCVRRCGAAAACNPLCVAAVQEELSPKRSEAVLAQQHLFSVYVHARAAYKDYPEGSVFQGRLIPDRVVRVQCLQGRTGMVKGRLMRVTTWVVDCHG